MKCFDVKNGDVVIAKNEITIVSGLELERQMITSVLGTNTGEWFLNENEGINFRTMLTKKPDYDLIRAEIISGLNQIDSDYVLTDFKHTLDKERNLLLSLVITKKTGEKISLDLNNGEVKKDYLTFENHIENLIALLKTLIVFDFEYELNGYTLTIKFEGEPTDENIINAQSKINSVMPDYITIVYEIEKPKSITKITVNAVKSAVVEIPRFPNTSEKGVIDWGDGTVEEYNPASSCSHTYVNSGDYDILIDCNLATISGLYIERMVSLELGNSTTRISTTAFMDNSKLKFIKLPKSITHIGNSVFFNCTKLTTIHYEGTEEEWNAIDKYNNWNYGSFVTEIIYNA